tara:strand:- start:2083 stop:2337 length:255 start_codon:yes stop_codon:yes gene_type:complete
MRNQISKRIKKALKSAGIKSPAIVSTTVNSGGHGGYNPTIDRSPDDACILRMLKAGLVDHADHADLPGIDQVLVCNFDDDWGDK